MAVKKTYTCVDCKTATCEMTDRTRDRGSSVREPGEALCMSCQSARVILVRQVDALPRSLDLIRAKRMVRV